MKPSFLYLLILPTILFYSNTISGQWVRQYPLAKLENVVDIAHHADGHGFAVGADDMILRLDPGIKKWELLTSWDGGWDLRAVDYLEDTNGAVVAAGGDGLILSTNAGQSWVEIPNGPEEILVIKIVNSADIIVVAAEGVFRWAGNTWTDLDLPVSSGVDGGCILDPQHIWCFTSGGSSQIFSTSNGGNTWNTSMDVERPDVIQFYNATYGIALDGRAVWKSENGGLQWTLVSDNAIHNSVNDITFGANPNVMMAATFNGEPTISTDSGVTWTKKELGLINQRNYAIASASDMEFWVGNDLSSITFSSDAGETWLETSGPDRKIMNDVFFLNRNFGFALGTDGKLLRTINGGSIWEDISFGETRSFLSLHGLTANDLWLGANQYIYHSSDMGDTWQQKSSILGSNAIDIHAISSTIVLACSTSGIIYRTADAGATWDTVYQTNNQIRSIAKIEGNRYMATGFNGLILRSEDQGLTWNPLTAPEAGLQYEQSQFIGQEGWLITSSFKKTMWHTTNAGNSWDPITLPIDRFWDGVYFITPDTGIIVGRSSTEGRAYITFNGGTNWQPGYITDFPLYGVTGLPNPNGSAWIFGFGSDIEILPYCNMLPTISDFVGNSTPCENDTVTYSITSEDVDFFFWLFPTNWEIIGNPNNDTVQVKVGRNSGTISVTGSNACGFSSPISVSAVPILLPNINSVLGTTSACEGEIITYDAIQTSGTDFTWSVPGDWTIQGSTNLESITVQVGELSGIVSVVGSNQCGESSPFNLAVTTELLPRVNSISGDASPCFGTVSTYTVDQEFADGVFWTFPLGWSVNGNMNGFSIDLVIGANSGPVTAIGANDCGESAQVSYDVLPLFVPLFDIIVTGNLLTLTSEGMSYQWYLNGVLIEGATGSEYLATVSGLYTATIVLENGCVTNAPPANVIISATKDHGKVLPVTVYPVPVGEILHIKGIQDQFTYSITNVTGAVVTTSTSVDPNINVSSIPEGVYILRLAQGTGIYMTRFVIMR